VRFSSCSRIRVSASSNSRSGLDGYGVRVLPRNEAKARSRFGDTVDIMVGDVMKPDTLNVLAAARDAGLAGRFLYMSAIGTTKWSLLAFLLNLIKGNMLRWRRRVEEEIRRSGLDDTTADLYAGPGG
jgi:uncharacterized protein YbjT (DUF2867 family)